MADIINIIDCGVTEITHQGKMVELPNELILFAADEIRDRYKANNKPDVPQPAGSRKNINIICSIFGHKHIITDNNVAKAAVCKRCGHKTSAIKWPNYSNA